MGWAIPAKGFRDDYMVDWLLDRILDVFVDKRHIYDVEEGYPETDDRDQILIYRSDAYYYERAKEQFSFWLNNCFPDLHLFVGCQIKMHTGAMFDSCWPTVIMASKENNGYTIMECIDLYLDAAEMDSDKLDAFDRKQDLIRMMANAEELSLTTPDRSIILEDVPIMIDPEAGYSTWFITDGNAKGQEIRNQLKSLSDDVNSSVFLFSYGGDLKPLLNVSYDELKEKGILSFALRDRLDEAFEWLGITPNRAVWKKIIP